MSPIRLPRHPWALIPEWGRVSLLRSPDPDTTRSAKGHPRHQGCRISGRPPETPVDKVEVWPGRDYSVSLSVGAEAPPSRPASRYVRESVEFRGKQGPGRTPVDEGRRSDTTLEHPGVTARPVSTPGVGVSGGGSGGGGPLMVRGGAGSIGPDPVRGVTSAGPGPLYVVGDPTPTVSAPGRRDRTGMTTPVLGRDGVGEGTVHRGITPVATPRWDSVGISPT